MRTENLFLKKPFFSFCVPQHNRTSFLLEALRSVERQTCRDFEICISDDGSTDGRKKEITDFLHSSGLSFVYKEQKENLRYDANLRAAIALAQGRYCFLLGNDDALASETVLEGLRRDIETADFPGVVVTNFKRFDTDAPVRRVTSSGTAGGGPGTAAAYFRNFSFVSGVLLKTQPAQLHATDRWDGSEMYQMYLGCRMIAEGASLLNLDRSVIREGIKIPGETVDSYTQRPKVRPCPLEERRLPLNDLGLLVSDAIRPYSKGRQRKKWNAKIFFQIFIFTYPFWIVEYRWVQSWKYAAGICLGMRPTRTMRGVELSVLQKAWFYALYACMTVLGLAVPSGFYRLLQGCLYKLSKKTH